MATLHFKGKTFVQNHHLTVKYHQLIPRKDKSLTDKVSLNDNLIIHGDNLKALKALLPTYAGKVRCIYIDPPYNKGNERWVYNDNVNSPMMQEWLGKVVDGEDLTRHGKWLCMMMPRLKPLRELLREEGLIFVSFDDNEVHHLRMLMDEVFGEGNFVSIMVRQTIKGGTDPSSSAGSGTAPHAVLDLNKEDGGNRKFMLVECEDYADRITAERVRRVIKGVKNAKDEKLREGLGGTFSYFELGDPIEMECILEGDKLPSYLDLARYVFYTATGEEFDPKKVKDIFRHEHWGL